MASVALAAGLAGCVRPDPAWDDLHARSQQEARAMVGRDYVFIAPAIVCRDSSGVYSRAFYGVLVDPGCRTIAAGLPFRVEDTVVLKNDGRTLLRVAGPGFAGFMAYETFLPKAYKTRQDYFPTGK